MAKTASNSILIIYLAATTYLCATMSAGAEIITETDRSSVDGDLFLEWRSQNSTLEGLPRRIEDLHQVLFNVALLPTVEAEIDLDTEPYLERMVRQRVPFLEWTDVVDNIYCDLNAIHCSRPRVPVPVTDWSALTKHVGGYAITSKSRSRWILREEHPIRLANFSFQPIANWSAFSVAPVNFNIHKIYDSALGCGALSGDPQSFNFGGGLRDFRAVARGSETSACAAAVFDFNRLHWLSVEADKQRRLTDSRALWQRRVHASLADSVKYIANEPVASAAWKRLDDIAASVYRGSSGAQSNIHLPVFSLGTTIAVSETPSMFNGVGDELLSYYGSYKSHVESLSQVAISNLAAHFLQLDVRYSGLGSVGSVDTHLGGDDVEAEGILQRHTASVLSPINFPLEEKVFEDNNVDRAIIFVDNGLNPEHCVFTGDCHPRWIDIASLNSPSATEADLFALVRSERENMKRGVGHGHGVAAIATAASSSGALVGVDPAAARILFDMNLSEWATERFRERAQAQLAALPGTFTVWNLSGHTESRDRVRPIDQYISEMVKSTNPSMVPYFVFAAGNVQRSQADDHHDAGDCLIYPACRTLNPKYTSVMTVVGAAINENGVPEPWRDNQEGIVSYTHPKFEIAAIADGVAIPSLASEAFYAAAGTSYAAPQVSAILLQLRSQLMNAAPEVVVGRIVGCGQMSTKLEGHVMGGLLDAECSLRFSETQVAFEPREGDEINPRVARELRPAKLLGIWNAQGPADILKLANEETGVTRSVRWWPEGSRPSFAGFRKFTDNDERFNFVTWDAKGELVAEVRGRLDSSHMLEVLFDGDEVATCIKASKLLEFIPGSAPFVSGARDHVSKQSSRCASGGGD